MNETKDWVADRLHKYNTRIFEALGYEKIGRGWWEHKITGEMRFGVPAYHMDQEDCRRAYKGLTGKRLESKGETARAEAIGEMLALLDYKAYQ